MSTKSFDDVLDILLEEGASPSHEDLIVWTARFPEFSQELASFFAIWAIQEAHEADGAPENSEHLANIGVSYALNLLHTRSREKEAMADAPAPAKPVRLSQMARKESLSLAQLATKVGLDEPLAMKFDLGRIRPLSDIPRSLIKRLSAALGTTAEAIWSSIAMPPIAASGGALRKAKGKAVVATETFESAIRKSSLSEQEQQVWLADTDRGEDRDEHVE